MLRQLEFPTDSMKRPQCFGILANDIVSKRLAPGVLSELKRVKLESDRPRHKLFRRLTSNIGYPKLREHLGSVITIMRLSQTWQGCVDILDNLHPKYG
jgi:hypothetical protein